MPPSDRTQTLQIIIELGRRIRSDADRQAFADQIKSFFGPAIRRSLAVDPPPARAEADLRQLIVAELNYLIRKLPATHPYFLEHPDAVAAQVVAICRWRRQLHRQSIAEAAAHEQGQRQQAIIRGHLDALAGARNQRLLAYLTPADRDALAYRTLRPLLAYLRHHPHQAVLCLNAQATPGFGQSLVGPYLTDQLALYVYLFKNKAEASFLHLAFEFVKRWIIHEIQSLDNGTIPDVDQEAEEMIGRIKLDFLGKYETQRQADTFYLDAKLTTYLTGFITTNRAIGKLLRQHNRRIDPDDADLEEQAYADYVHTEQADRFHSEQLTLLQRCLRKLPPDCQKLLSTMFGDGLTEPLSLQTLADRMGKAMTHLQRRYALCSRHLRTLLTDRSSADL